MSDYKTMYTVLFRKITAIIEDLQDIQRQTEEMYISSNSTNIKILPNSKTQNEETTK